MCYLVENTSHEIIAGGTNHCANILGNERNVIQQNNLIRIITFKY